MLRAALAVAYLGLFARYAAAGGVYAPSAALDLGPAAATGIVFVSLWALA
jgi:hypothetical protein